MAWFLNLFLIIYKNIINFYKINIFLHDFFNNVSYTGYSLNAWKVKKNICKTLIYYQIYAI